jgi:predicted NBD/HSP70 family sugar kinase
MTVSQRLDTLLASGMVLDGQTGDAATGGRRRRVLVFNNAHSRVVSVAVDTTHTRIAVTDLGGRILADDEIDVSVAAGPSTVLDQIATAVVVLLEKMSLTPADLCGAGLSMPGPIDPASGRPSQPPILPGWDAYPVAEHLQGALPGVPVHTANDADASALGEYAASYDGVGSLCLVKVSTGIGTGIVIDGRLYTGTDGGAGDIGHVRAGAGDEALCQCGMRGCLAAVASGRAVAASLAELGYRASSARDVRDLLQAGNADAAHLTQVAGQRIGEVMATMVCVLNPEVVLIGGALASAPLLAGIRETLYRSALPRATRHMSLQLGVLDQDAALVGLTRFVVDHEYSPERLNQHMRP